MARRAFEAVVDRPELPLIREVTTAPRAPAGVTPLGEAAVRQRVIEVVPVKPEYTVALEFEMPALRREDVKAQPLNLLSHALGWEVRTLLCARVSCL